MQRRSRLAVIGGFKARGKMRFKDYITGEELDADKITQRIKDGIYSAYQVHHLNLSSGAFLR